MKAITKLIATILLGMVSFVYAETININTANLDSITQELKGIGTVKATAIIEYRNEHGDFTALNDLLNVPGIGTKILEQIKDQVVFTPSDAPPPKNAQK